MLLREFDEQVTDISDLIEFCWENDIYEWDFYTEDSYNDAINEELSERADNDNWWDVRDWLENVTSGYDYYYRTDCGDWYGVSDSDFDWMFGELRETLINSDWFDADEDENEEEEPVAVELPELEDLMGDVSFDQVMRDTVYGFPTVPNLPPEEEEEEEPHEIPKIPSYEEYMGSTMQLEDLFR